MAGHMKEHRELHLAPGLCSNLATPAADRPKQADREPGRPEFELGQMSLMFSVFNSTNMKVPSNVAHGVSTLNKANFFHSGHVVFVLHTGKESS